MSYSEEQGMVIYSDFKDIMLVKAYAGTGKSFTLKQFCKKHSDKTFLYFVYNASMKIDAMRSFKGIANVIISTFHGAARQAVGKPYLERLEKEEELKVFDLLKYFPSKEVEEEDQIYFAHVLLKVIRDFTSSADTIEGYIKRHKSRHSLGEINDSDALGYALEKLKDVWEDIINPKNESIPFEHDFYLKIFQLKKMKFNYDYVLVDEAQDISPVMIDIILTQTQAKKIFVGDTFQSIYGWRGAVDSLTFIEKRYSPSVYFLSQSFRCPPKVAWLANQVIKLAGAQKDFIGVATPAPVTKQVTYIARTNSGLFSLCVENLDKKIYYVGGIKKYKFSLLKDILNLMSGNHDYIKNEFIKNFPDFSSLNKYAREMNDISMIGTIGIVLKHMGNNLHGLIAALKESATTKIEDADIVVTTAHRSKGLEWAQIELVDDFPFASETKMSRANVGEELRLLYVAITRAMNSVKVPEEILDYLQVEGGRSEYVGSVRVASDLDDIVANYKDIEETEAKKIFVCTFCFNGDIYGNNVKCYCDKCTFEIKYSKIVKFFSMFKKEIDLKEAAEISKAIISMKSYPAKSLISKDGKEFDASLVFEEKEKFGWGVGFAPKKKNNI
ncbi:MAG: ATP-dependent helicase [Epsilonproteobacteria bacterium]|nr:ATP-dependent helicase [Campylobacterota bacterium]